MNSRAKITILIAGSGDYMRRSVRTMLRISHYGWKILETDDGVEAWDLLRKNRVDLIIADHTIPGGMNGVELLRHVRENRKLRDTLFLIITAEANREAVAEAAEHDVDGYLALPFDSATLSKTIDTILTRARYPEPMVIHLKAARNLKDEGKTAEAIEECQKAAAAKPDSSRPLRELGKLHMEIGEKKEAITYFQKSIALNQLDISSHYYLGKLLVEEDKVDQAVEHFSRALKINPRRREWTFDFASLLLKRDRKKEAAKILGRIPKHNPSDIELLEKTGEIAARHDLDDLAIKCFQVIVKKQADKMSGHRMLGILLQRKKRNLEAVHHLEKAVKEYEADLDVLLALIKAYRDMRRIGPAEEWGIIASKLHPDKIEVKKLLNFL